MKSQGTPHRGRSRLGGIIGDRGELLFELSITRYEDFEEPLFKPAFLGEKWARVDYLVELQGISGTAPYFFVQVKATADPLLPHATALSIDASKDQCERLFHLPGPTYLVGVHEPSGRSFIISMHCLPEKGSYSIPVTHELTPSNLLILHTEVAEFWGASQGKPRGSHFS